MFSLPHLSEVQTVENGQILDVPDKPRILHTPGHTDGEIALLLEDRKIVITGDAIVTSNLLTGELGQSQLTNPILNKNYKQAMYSLDKLREPREVMMLFGHGTS